jgi:hypothetical protein
MAQHVSALMQSATRQDGYSFRPSAPPSPQKTPRSFCPQFDANSGGTNETCSEPAEARALPDNASPVETVLFPEVATRSPREAGE